MTQAISAVTLAIAIWLLAITLDFVRLVVTNRWRQQ